MICADSSTRTVPIRARVAGAVAESGRRDEAKPGNPTGRSDGFERRSPLRPNRTGNASANRLSAHLRQNLLGDDHPLHLRRALVDLRGADVAEEALDAGAAAVAFGRQNLHRAIGGAMRGL